MYGVVEEDLRGERAEGALRGGLEEGPLLAPEYRVLHVVPLGVLVLYRRHHSLGAWLGVLLCHHRPRPTDRKMGV